MGGTISKLAGAESDEEIKESLKLSQDIAEQKLATFEGMLRESKTDEMKIPVDKELNVYSKTASFVSQDAKNISKGISDALGSFVHGNIMDGVNTIISGGITAILGDDQAGSKTEKKYLIFMTKHGAIERLDYELYRYKFTAKKIIEKTESILVVTYAISSAEIVNLDINTVLSIIDNQYGGLDEAAYTTLKEAVIKLMDDASARRKDLEDLKGKKDVE